MWLTSFCCFNKKSSVHLVRKPHATCTSRLSSFARVVRKILFLVIPSTSNAIGRYYVTTVHGLLGSTADAHYDYGEAFFYTSFDSAKAAGDLWASNTRCKTPWFAVLRLVDKGADGSLLV